MTEPNKDTRQTERITPEGVEAIKTFQSALVSNEPQDRRNKVRKFYDQLAKIVYFPDQRDLMLRSDESLEKQILLGEDLMLTGGLWIGTGTSGERIIFTNYDSETDQETSDKMVGWMIYPKPDTQKGMEFWQRYVEHFGDLKVNLRTKL